MVFPVFYLCPKLGQTLRETKIRQFWRFWEYSIFLCETNVWLYLFNNFPYILAMLRTMQCISTRRGLLFSCLPFRPVPENGRRKCIVLPVGRGTFPLSSCNRRTRSSWWWCHYTQPLLHGPGARDDSNPQKMPPFGFLRRVKKDMSFTNQ